MRLAGSWCFSQIPSVLLDCFLPGVRLALLASRLPIISVVHLSTGEQGCAILT